MSGKGTRPFRVGLIGLGIMGVPIARRLLSRNWELTAWNLESDRFGEIAGAGAQWAETPAALRAAADMVLICVLGDDAVESVVLGEGGLAAGHGGDAVVDLSTTSVETTRRLAASIDMEWLDCPISGGPQAAADGVLTLMAGGSPALFERVRPVLDDMAGNLTLMGPIGAGQTTKILNQAIVGTNYVLMAELLAQARAAGIDGAKLAGCLKGGLADSVILQRIFPQMLARDFEQPTGRVKQLNKDLCALEAFNAGLGLELPLQELAIRQYRAYAEAGNGEMDSASVSLLYEPKEN